MVVATIAMRKDTMASPPDAFLPGLPADEMPLRRNKFVEQKYARCQDKCTWINPKTLCKT